MRKTHAEITVSVDGNQVICQVPYRYLNQVAEGDGFYSDKDYVQIALANAVAVETAVRTKMNEHVSGKSIRLERSDFPPKA